MIHNVVGITRNTETIVAQLTIIDDGGGQTPKEVELAKLLQGSALHRFVDIYEKIRNLVEPPQGHIVHSSVAFFTADRHGELKGELHASVTTHEPKSQEGRQAKDYRLSTLLHNDEYQDFVTLYNALKAKAAAPASDQS